PERLKHQGPWRARSAAHDDLDALEFDRVPAAAIEHDLEAERVARVGIEAAGAADQRAPWSLVEARLVDRAVDVQVRRLPARLERTEARARRDADAAVVAEHHAHAVDDRGDLVAQVGRRERSAGRVERRLERDAR